MLSYHLSIYCGWTEERQEQYVIIAYLQTEIRTRKIEDSLVGR
jgi:hypothetical protein